MTTPQGHPLKLMASVLRLYFISWVALVPRSDLQPSFLPLLGISPFSPLPLPLASIVLAYVPTPLLLLSVSASFLSLPHRLLIEVPLCRSALTNHDSIFLGRDVVGEVVREVVGRWFRSWSGKW